MATVVVVKSCVPGTLFATLLSLLPRNASSIKNVCALGYKEMDAEGFGIVERMGALKLSESSFIVTIQILKICTAQARQQNPHIDKFSFRYEG